MSSRVKGGHLGRKPRAPDVEDEAARLRAAFISWWFDHKDDSRFFNAAMLASPTLADAIRMRAGSAKP